MSKLNYIKATGIFGAGLLFGALLKRGISNKNDLIATKSVDEDGVLKASSVDTSDWGRFSETLLNAFKNNEKSVTDDPKTRVALIRSFSEYLINTDESGKLSLGDVLRREDTFKKFISDDLNSPLIVGTDQDKDPLVIDYADNTAGLLIGGSGAGKSWALVTWMINTLISSSPKDEQFIVFDIKDSCFWKAFAMMPHVLALHGDADKDNFNDYLDEIEAERVRRQKYLQEIGMEDVRSAHRKFKSRALDGDPYAQEVMDNLPLLNVIIEEESALRAYYQGLDDEGVTDKAFTAKLGALTAKSRAAGIRIFQIAQRSTDKSIYKTTRANSSFVFGMKMSAESDFSLLFGTEADKVKFPDRRGEGLLKADKLEGIKDIDSLTMGTTDDDQLLALIRVLAFDWIRRLDGKYNPLVKPLNTGYSANLYNRPLNYLKAVADLRAGRILSSDPKESTPKYSYDLNV